MSAFDEPEPGGADTPEASFAWSGEVPVRHRSGTVSQIKHHSQEPDG